MRKTLIALILLVVIASVLFGCHSKEQKYMLSGEQAQQEKAKEQSQLANPATIFCINTTGASWQVKEDAQGNQQGICLFQDQSWCDEWDYYRGDCEPGFNYTKCGDQFWGKMSCPPDYVQVCARIEIGTNAPYQVRYEEFTNPCEACISSTKTEVVVGYTHGACPE